MQATLATTSTSNQRSNKRFQIKNKRLCKHASFSKQKSKQAKAKVSKEEPSQTRSRRKLNGSSSTTVVSDPPRKNDSCKHTLLHAHDSSPETLHMKKNHRPERTRRRRRQKSKRRRRQQAPKRDTDGDIAPNQRKGTHAEPDRASSQQPRR
jgi:hypothetical protein